MRSLSKPFCTLMDIEELLEKYSEGRLSPEEADELHRRVSSSPEDAEAFRRWREAETLGRMLYQMEHLNEENAWHNLQARLHPRENRFRRTQWMLIAAGLALLLGLGTWLLWTPTPSKDASDRHSLAELFPNKTDTVATLILSDGREIALGKDSTLQLDEAGRASITQTGTGVLAYNASPASPNASAAYNQVCVPKGSSYTLVLSDGTRVHLNADSRLRYPVNFNGTRQVELEGEAYFEVHHEHTPFEVVTTRCRLSVLGTVFNVEAYHDPPVVTTLVQGCVEVRTQQHSVRLTPGEQAQVESLSDVPEVKSVNADLYTSWVTGTFRFKNTSLADIAGLLSRWYDVDIRCADPNLEAIRLAGNIYRNRELGYTLELLSRVTGLTFDRQADGSILIQD